MDLFLLIKKGINKYCHIFWSILNKVVFCCNHVQYGKNLKVRGKVYVYRHYKSSSVKMGDNITINSAAWANPIGVGERTYFQVFNSGRITIGNGCGISNTGFACASEITIGNDVMIGSGCKIYDNDFHSVRFEERYHSKSQCEVVATAPIKIDDGAFIGAGTYILKGVHIGRYSVVGAASVVTHDIPSGEIWAGNPARFIKKIDSQFSEMDTRNYFV